MVNDTTRLLVLQPGMLTLAEQGVLAGADARAATVDHGQLWSNHDDLMLTVGQRFRRTEPRGGCGPS
jgi:hypothetical protein